MKPPSAVAAGVAVRDTDTGKDYGFHPGCWDDFRRKTADDVGRLVEIGPLFTSRFRCPACRRNGTMKGGVPVPSTRAITSRYASAISRTLRQKFNGRAWAYTQMCDSGVWVGCADDPRPVKAELQSRGYHIDHTEKSPNGEYTRFYITTQTVSARP